MIEIEAKRLAETIREAALPEIHVEAIERFHEAQLFQIRCCYNGPTFKYNQQLFLHGMHFYIANAYEWAQVYMLLKRR